MKVAIHQPQYWPWPRYIHKIMSADLFVYLDTVQFSKNGVQNRNQIKTNRGPLWLTVPVKQRLGQTILETRLADATATEKHWKTLKANYSSAPGYDRWKDELQSLLQQPWHSLCDAAIDSTEWLLDKLSVGVERVRASELEGVNGQSSELIGSICRHVGATTYLTGEGALAYLELKDFSAAGCDVWLQDWKGLQYTQTFPAAGFLPDLSTLDLLLNCPVDAGDLIRGAGGWTLIPGQA